MSKKNDKKILVLIDIDGVVNPGFKLNKDLIYINFDINKVGITKDVVEFLKYLAKDERLLVCWSSRWEHYSNKINRKLNIRDFPYLQFTNKDNKQEDYNILLSKEKNSKEYKHIVIIDEDFENVHNLPNVTSFAPVKQNGLTKKDIKEIVYFLKEL